MQVQAFAFKTTPLTTSPLALSQQNKVVPVSSAVVLADRFGSNEANHKTLSAAHNETKKAPSFLEKLWQGVTQFFKGLFAKSEAETQKAPAPQHSHEGHGHKHEEGGHVCGSDCPVHG